MIQIPSKTFVAGEYAVLEGSPALVLGHAPFFHASLGEKSFHPDSPAGTYLKQQNKNLHFDFYDPHQGKGGFGGSGAEFVAAYSFVEGKNSFDSADAWKLWEAFPRSEGSGMDVLVQSFGAGKEAALYSIDQKNRIIQNAPSLGVSYTLFHTGKKLPTHEHLRTELPALDPVKKQLVRLLTSFGNRQKFCSELNNLGDCLDDLGLLAAHSKAAVQEIRSLPGIWAAKGCGAMGSDVILVLHDAGLSSWQEWAQKHQLSKTTEGTI